MNGPRSSMAMTGRTAPAAAARRSAARCWAVNPKSSTVLPHGSLYAALPEHFPTRPKRTSEKAQLLLVFH